VNFYDEVMREMVLGLGAALFVANAYALLRRRADARRAAAGAPAVRRGNSAMRNEAKDLVQAPIARTVTYMLIGLVVALWALASIVG
jgi:type II secretory pathway component PulM